MFELPLTIVLPIHNGERRIRSSVLDILDLSQSITANLQLVIVDDGSTDDTFETACEMARAYPQIVVLRQRQRLGLEATLQMVRRKVSADMMVVHDGTAKIESAQLRTLLEEEIQQWKNSSGMSTMESAKQTQSSDCFASVRSVQQGLEQVHKPLLGFRWMQTAAPLVPRRRTGLPSVGLPEIPLPTPTAVPPASS